MVTAGTRKRDELRPVAGISKKPRGGQAFLTAAPLFGNYLPPS